MIRRNHDLAGGINSNTADKVLAALYRENQLGGYITKLHKWERRYIRIRMRFVDYPGTHKEANNNVNYFYNRHLCYHEKSLVLWADLTPSSLLLPLVWCFSVLVVYVWQFRYDGFFRRWAHNGADQRRDQAGRNRQADAIDFSMD